MLLTGTPPACQTETQAFLDQEHGLLIDDDRGPAASGKRLEVTNPATGEKLSSVAEGDSEDVQRAVVAARRAFEPGPWSKITTTEQGKMIWKLADLLEAHLDEFAKIQSLDNGEPLRPRPTEASASDSVERQGQDPTLP